MNVSIRLIKGIIGLYTLSFFLMMLIRPSHGEFIAFFVAGGVALLRINTKKPHSYSFPRLIYFLLLLTGMAAWGSFVFMS